MCKYDYFTKEMSWLSFNERVLDEAADPSLSSKEKLKFLAIYSSNLDEFLKVKIVNLRALVDEEGSNAQYLSLLEDINNEISRQQKRFFTILERNILPELKDKDFELIKEYNYDEEIIAFTNKYFKRTLYFHLQPTLISDKVIMPFIEDGHIYVAVKLYKKNKNGNLKKKEKYGFINVPSDELGRFITINSKLDQRKKVVLLEDVIKRNVDTIFPGYVVKGAYNFALLRDADIDLGDEFEGDLPRKIEKAIAKRKTGVPCRFLYDATMPLNMVLALQKAFNLADDDMESLYGYHKFSDFMNYPIEDEEIDAEVVDSYSLNKESEYLKQIEKNDHLLHFPYQSYEHVLKFLNEAAYHPGVTEIMITQYRVASGSAVIKSLINAAKNGKKVSVFVELKARFDEEQNLYFAEKMKRAGVNIYYSMPGIKVHSKIILIKKYSRSLNADKLYSFVSTGNFNEKTAQIYNDIGYFTYDKEVCNDVLNVFEMLKSGKIEKPEIKKLLVSPFSTRTVISNSIKKEIENVQNGFDGHIIMKMNGMADKGIATLLYQALEAGVKVELIVRGKCIIMPEQEYSKDLKLIRIIDKYLEHSRVYYFKNNDSSNIFIGSADLMKRNLDLRVEVLTPIKEEKHKQEILDILNIYLSDNVKACYINQHLQNVKIETQEKPIRSQKEIFNYLKSKL